MPNSKTDVSVEEGENAKFKCIVSGEFNVTWRWLHQSKSLKETTRVKMRDYNFLKIRKVKKKDAGYYVCSVTNKFGTTEIVYRLKVRGESDISISAYHYFLNFRRI